MRRRFAGAAVLLVASAVAAATGASPAASATPTASPRPTARATPHRSPGHGNGSASNRPQVILDSSALKRLLVTPSPLPTRKPNILINHDPDVFSTTGTQR